MNLKKVLLGITICLFIVFVAIILPILLRQKAAPQNAQSVRNLTNIITRPTTVTVVTSQFSSMQSTIGATRSTMSSTETPTTATFSTSSSTRFEDPRCQSGFWPMLIENQIPFETRSLVVADTNDDRHLDLVFVSNFYGFLGVAFGYGNHTFSSVDQYSLGIDSHPSSITVVDLNNDSKLDIVVVNSGFSTIVTFLGVGNGSFTPCSTHPIPFEPYIVDMAIEDMNNDGKSDLVLIVSRYNVIHTLFGHGNGSFASAISFIGDQNIQPSGFILFDINYDGITDIILVHENNNTVKTYISAGNGTFKLDSTQYLLRSSNYMINTDLDGDGSIDLVLLNNPTKSLMIYHLRGNGTVEYRKILNFSPPFYAEMIAFGDLNNDGLLDIVAPLLDGDLILIFIQNFNGSFQVPISIRTHTSFQPSSLAVADVNDDGYNDILVTSSYKNQLALILGGC